MGSEMGNDMNLEDHYEALPITTTQAPRADSADTFTTQERVALLSLRRQYREGHDLWNARELAQLRFCRWLRRQGRLES